MDYTMDKTALKRYFYKVMLIYSFACSSLQVPFEMFEPPFIYFYRSANCYRLDGSCEDSPKMDYLHISYV